MNNSISKNKDALRMLAEKQQGDAANPKVSVWVEASAGTGKTKVLSDRVLRMLLSGVDASKILCLTYTKAAAVEMNMRISKRLGEWAIITEEKLKEELFKIIGEEQSDNYINNARVLFAKVLDTPGGIKIQTIHSFCEEILKRFPLEADIAPYFSVMDDRMSVEALTTTSKKLILKAQDEPDSQIGKYISWLTANIKELKFSQIMEKIASNRNKLLQILSQYSSFELFVDALCEKLGVNKHDTPEQVFINFESKLNKDIIKKIANTLSNGSKKDIDRSVLLYECLEKFDYQKYKAVFLTKENKICSTLAYKSAVNMWPEIIEEMSKLAQDVLNLEEYFIKLGLAQSTQAIMGIAEGLNLGYSEYKRNNAMLDFEDLIVITRKLLNKENVSKWVLYKLDGGIDHILIDEAQDTSPNQWAIVKSITDEFFAGLGQRNNVRTVFAVGDRKQSIYSFQGADPDEFDRMFYHFQSKDSNFKKIKLDVSFRSTKAVLESVNSLFALDEAKSGVVINEEKVSHLPYRIGEGGVVQILPMVVADNDAEDVWYPPVERKTKTSASMKLSSLIANKIKSMVDKKEILESQNRPVCYKDFMVLVQRRNNFIEDFVRECKNIGVNISGIDKLKLLEQLAVQDLLSLANFLLLPQDDLSLAEVLKSPLFGLTDDDLFELCYNRKNDSLWHRLKQNSKYETINQELSEILKKSDYLRPYELFNYILISLNGRKRFVERLGTEAEDTLDEFINLTLNFENNHIPDLQTFVSWVKSGDVEIKRELEQAQENAVRVMTVHGSKGLQAPIVIVPDTTRTPNIKRGEDILYSEDSDMIYFPLSADSYDSICEEIHSDRVKKAYDEYRRLLYVALTRAEDRLYIAGYKNKGDADEKSWYHLCKQTLELIGIQSEDKSISYSSKQEIECSSSNKESQINNVINAESWLYENAVEEAPLARPYSPSKSEQDDELIVCSPLKDNSFYYKRGLLIHSLLQYIPVSCNFEDKLKAIDVYLQQYGSGLSQNMLNQIKEEISYLISHPDFKEIFGTQSRAEVPIIGEVDGHIVSAQVDRLVITENKVIIVDFKTNRPAAVDIESVPKAYLKQLASYRKLLENIYPDKEIETYILWTNTAHLMKIV